MDDHPAVMLTCHGPRARGSTEATSEVAASVCAAPADGLFTRSHIPRPTLVMVASACGHQRKLASPRGLWLCLRIPGHRVWLLCSGPVVPTGQSHFAGPPLRHHTKTRCGGPRGSQRRPRQHTRPVWVSAPGTWTQGSAVWRPSSCRNCLRFMPEPHVLSTLLQCLRHEE